MILDEPVTKCVSLCFPTWVRSVIPARGAETTVYHKLTLLFEFWDSDIGLNGFTPESTEPYAAGKNAAGLAENEPPPPPPPLFPSCGFFVC